ncbi:MAG: hypothetical protein U1E14_00830 [Geminicoccaceae bacterium]
MLYDVRVGLAVVEKHDRGASSYEPKQPLGGRQWPSIDDAKINHDSSWLSPDDGLPQRGLICNAYDQKAGVGLQITELAYPVAVLHERHDRHGVRRLAVQTRGVV